MLDVTDQGDDASQAAAPTLIYDPALYEKEVLLLPYIQTEDGLDEELTIAARELQIPDADRCVAPDSPDISATLSSLTFSSEHRSSISIRSHSTSLTSDPSRDSKEHPPLDASSIGLTALPQPPSYDSVVEIIWPSLAHSRASSTASNSPGNPFHAAARRLSMNRRRSHVSAMFRRGSRPSSPFSSKSRGDTDSVSSPRPSTSEQSVRTSLECGHSWSKSSIRHQVKAATSSDDYHPPDCCGKPIPSAILETVMSKMEMDELVRGLVQTYGLDTGSYAQFFIFPQPGTRPPPLELLTLPECGFLNADSSLPLTDEAIRLGRAFSDGGYQALIQQQTKEISRFRLFEYKQRRALARHHYQKQEEIWTRHTLLREKLRNKHSLALEQLEEGHVSSELEMRNAHTDETQKVATALKYMERYCQEHSKPLTQLSTAESTVPEEGEEPLRHLVSDDDRSKLKRQYRLRDSLPSKHGSAINVLRAKQEKELRTKQEQHTQELSELSLEFNKRSIVLEMTQAKESDNLEDVLKTRERRLRLRWELRTDIWRNEYERREGPIPGKMRSVEWPDPIPFETEVEGVNTPSALDILIRPT